MLIPKENPLFKQVYDFVFAGDIDLAVDKLQEFISSNQIESRQLPLTLNMIKARNNMFKRDVARGVMTDEQRTVKANQITHAILDTVSSLEVKFPVTPPPAQPVAPAAKATIFEKVIGPKSNLKSISWLRMGLDKSRSICRIFYRNQVGTGFIGPDGWLYTNNHVLPTTDEVKAAAAQFNFERNPDGSIAPSVYYTLDPDSFYTNKDLDFSRVKLVQGNTKEPISDWGQLTFKPREIANDEHVTIIQHPNGEFKQIAMNENKVLGTFQHYLQYTTDTMPGSSGSPVFDDDWNVVAIHHAGGDLVYNDAGDTRYTNQAILVAEILKDLGE